MLSIDELKRQQSLQKSNYFPNLSISQTGQFEAVIEIVRNCDQNSKPNGFIIFSIYLIFKYKKTLLEKYLFCGKNWTAPTNSIALITLYYSLFVQNSNRSWQTATANWFKICGDNTDWPLIWIEMDFCFHLEKLCGVCVQCPDSFACIAMRTLVNACAWVCVYAGSCVWSHFVCDFF